MVLDLLTRPEVCDDGEVADAEGVTCIYCPCRPDVSYCGAYDDGPGEPLLVGDDTCVDCYEVYVSTGCPCCGCVRDANCRQCGPRWWRRWWSR